MLTVQLHGADGKDRVALVIYYKLYETSYLVQMAQLYVCNHNSI
jgi:hypothetical protein